MWVGLHQVELAPSKSFGKLTTPLLHPPSHLYDCLPGHIQNSRAIGVFFQFFSTLSCYYVRMLILVIWRGRANKELFGCPKR